MRRARHAGLEDAAAPLYVLGGGMLLSLLATVTRRQYASDEATR